MPVSGSPMPNKFAARFRIAPGKRVQLAKVDPRDASAFPDREAAEARSTDDAKAINDLQDRLFAEGKRALLVVLQGTDTSGKDGTIRHVFNETGPLGVSVTSFRRPSEEELAHDFLWRLHLACPRRGTIGIFNRSHYEDVLVGRVRKLAPAKDIEARYEQINAFEKMLTENGTTILKFMLHISKKEQAERLQERLDEPDKRWKFDPRDLEERKLWDQYQAAYELVLNKCSTAWAPWHVIPADRKWARNAAIAAIVRETLEAMNPKYPKPDWNPKDFKID
jgi:PPK2 family polyphosphate:nucleotide phosphotransferase